MDSIGQFIGLADNPVAALSREKVLKGANESFKQLKGAVWSADNENKFSFINGQVNGFLDRVLNEPVARNHTASFSDSLGREVLNLKVIRFSDPSLRDFTFLKIGNLQTSKLNRPALIEFFGLSKSEADVVELLVRGNTTIASMATEKGVSEHTIRSQMSAVYRKLDVSDKSEVLVKVLSDARFVSQWYEG